MKSIALTRLRPLLLVALTAAAVALPRGLEAQLMKGQKTLGVHIGLSGVGSAAAYGVNGEVAYNDHISIGGWLDTWSYGENYTYSFGTADWSVRYIALAGTGAYHFPLHSNPKLDPFLGVALGYYIVSSSTSSSLSGTFTYRGSASRVFLGGFGGVRYHFKPNLAAVARVGFGASYLTLGIDYTM